MIYIRLVFENANAFRKNIEAIAALIDEAEFIVSEKGLTLKATDPSQIAMVDFEMPKNSFKEFQVDKELKLGADMDYFRQIMSRAKADDVIVLEIGADKAALSIKFLGKSSRSFSMPLIDVSKGQIPNPKIEFEAELSLKAGLIQDSLKDAEILSAHIIFGVRNGIFYVSANSSRGTFAHEVQKNDSSIKKFEATKDCKAMFPLDYLKNMLKVLSSEDELKLFLKSDAPLKLEFMNEKARITYYLAPRIDVE
ncbi:MAG: proliferating cell nuclear antigen (pcna) [Candidatus Diapherotrites archaeon]|nr:proliferating cell nuclear antigen (pcna) [Candidatus Diapherotrites archaeon]